MDGIDIYNRALRQTHTDSADYLSTEADEDIEFRHQELVDEIVNVTKGDYFWDSGVSDTVIDQSEYVAEKLGISPDDLDIKKINKVFIKYTDTQSYPSLAKYQNPGTLKEHPDYYKVTQSRNEPFFYIQDNSIFIYPAPTEVVVGGVEIYVIHKPALINTSSLEADIEIPIQFHKLLATGLKIDIYTTQGKINEANAAQAEYIQGIKSMLAFMKQRYNQPVKRTFVNNLNDFR